MEGADQIGGTAFVLSGGGSLGANQVGMLRALYERGVRPDFLVATSIGAFNSAFIASRPNAMTTIEELAELWRQAAENTPFKLQPIRLLMALVGLRSHFVAAEGMRRALQATVQFDLLEQAATPLHVVVTDLLSGDDLRLSSGSVLDAVLASSALPGIMAPVEWEGRLLVDGGIADNTPIGHAVELGAERVYLLPTGTASAREHMRKGILPMIAHWLGLTHERQTVLDIGYWRERIELIVLPPPLPQDVSPSDFSRAEDLMERSYRTSSSWLGTPGGPIGRFPDELSHKLPLLSPGIGDRGGKVRASERGEERTAFVFLGGLALGPVQAGMLRALYERGIKPDLIVGCSIGALNAALVAPRPMTAETGVWLGELWGSLRRQDLFPLNPIRVGAGLAGLLDGGTSPRRLRRFLRRHVELSTLEASPVPLHLMATELMSGAEQRLSEGDAALAVQASMAYPAFLPPVLWGEKRLIAGGVAENTIPQALELGAATVYALPTGHPTDLDRAPRSALHALIQIGGIAHWRQIGLEIERVKDSMRLIVMPPPFPQPRHHYEFDHAPELVDRSYAEASRFLDQPGDLAGRMPPALVPRGPAG